MTQNLQEYLAFINPIAKKAGEVLISFFDKNLNIQKKSGQNDLVSEADLTSEKLILEAISSEYPDHSILAEESGKTEKSDLTWIIDPLDGTTNFIHGIPFFAVNIALVEKDEILLGVTYNPIIQEHFWSYKNGGAYLNGSKVKVSNQQTISESLLATGFPYERDTEDFHNSIKETNQLQARARGIRRLGSAALDLAYVACGKLDGFFERNLKPWDITAGISHVKEAGGIVTDFTGTQITLKQNGIAASNNNIHEELLSNLVV